MLRIYLALVAAVLTIIAGCGWFYYLQFQEAREEIESNIVAIGTVEADGVKNWFGERLQHGKLFAQRPLLNRRMLTNLETQPVQFDADVVESIEAFLHAEGYSDILVFDPQANALLAVGGTPHADRPDLRRLAERSVREKGAVISDVIHVGDPNSGIVAVAVPLLRNPTDQAEIGAVIVSVTELANSLHTLLGAWPTPSRSAETYLLQRIGDRLHYVSPLRFGAALAVQDEDIAVDDMHIAAVQAVEAVAREGGRPAIFSGVDYRKVPVLSTAIPVQGTSCYLIAEIDASEAYAPWRRESYLILTLFFALIALPLLLTGFIWQTRQRNSLAVLAQANAQLHNMNRLYNMLSQTNALVLHARTQQELLDGAARIGVEVGGFRFVWIGRPDAQGNVLPIARAGDDDGYIDTVRANTSPDDPRGQGPTGQVLRNGVTIITNDFLADHATAPWHDVAQRAGIGASGVFPILHEGKVWATFNIYTVQGGFFQQREVEALEEVVKALSFALDKLAAENERGQAVAQVHQLSERLTAYLADSPVMNYALRVVDGNVEPEWVAENIERLLGYTEAEAMAPGWWESNVHPDDQAAALAVLENLPTAGAVRHEYRFRRKDGSYVWILDSQEVHATNESNVTQVIGAWADITPQHNTLDRLRESELRFRTLVEELSVGVILVDTETRVILSNQAARDIFGLDEQQISGRTSLHPRLNVLQEDGTPFPPEQLPTHRVLNTRAPVHNQVMGFTRITTGEQRWASISAMPRLDSTGAIIHILVTVSDITTEHLARQDLQRSREQLDRAVAASKVALWEWDLVNDRFECSDEWCRHIGCTRADLTGSSADWLSRMHPDEVRELDIFRGGIDDAPVDASTHEFRLRDNQGEYRWFLGSFTICRNAEGLPVRLSGANLDITDRRKLEDEFRQAQRMESIGRLAGGVAHDFNNLLSVIGGYTEMALNTIEEGTPLHRDLSQVKQASDRAANLTRQLLAFSRRQVLRPEVRNLNTLVSDSEKMLRRLVGEDINIITHLAADLWKVLVDPGQIEQVLMNLVVNARDAMPFGGQLTITTVNRELSIDELARIPGLHQPRCVELIVSDTGAGMDAATMQRIFEPFFTTKEQGKGTGLGLATVYGIVKQSGGSITVNSTINIGTTFRIYLPAVLEEKREGEHAAAEELKGGAETILLVEDEEVLRQLTYRLLNNLGYKVLTADSGQAALDTAAGYSGQIDLLLTDVIMPGISGAQLARELVQQRPGLRVLFMSGYTDDAISHHGVLEAGKHLINKPFGPSALARQIRQLLDEVPPGKGN